MVILDLVDQRGAADIALVATIVFMVLSALSGLADYTDTDATARTRATTHATLMTVALVILLIWLISPIDLIPEFIPILGPLDDVIVAVIILRYVRRRLGAQELRRRWRGTEAGWTLVERLLAGR